MTGGAGTRACRAGTRACRAGTRAGAWRIVSGARPRVVLRPYYQPRLDRILLNIPRNPVPLRLIAYPVVVGFPLPKTRSRSIQDSIGFPRRYSLQRLHQLAGWGFRKQKCVDVIWHDGVRAKLVVTHCDPLIERGHHYLRDGGLPQIHGANGGRVQVSVHPNESSAISRLRGGRVAAYGESAVQTPRDEDPFSLGVNVRETPAVRQHIVNVRAARPDSQSNRQTPRLADIRQAPARVPARQARVPALHNEDPFPLGINVRETPAPNSQSNRPLPSAGTSARAT